MELFFDQSAFNALTGELKTELRRTREADKSYTKVGYTLKAGMTEDDEGNPRPLTKVALAAIHEFGTSHVPERPFMRQAFDNRIDAIETFTANVYARYMLGEFTNKRALQLIGEWFMGEVKEEIRKGSFTPLKPSTVKKKGSSKPLIDTGLNLLGGIDHEEVL